MHTYMHGVNKYMIIIEVFKYLCSHRKLDILSTVCTYNVIQFENWRKITWVSTGKQKRQIIFHPKMYMTQKLIAIYY